MSLYDADGCDVAIETVDNGNNTIDVSFVPQSVGTLTAKVFFDDVEIPNSLYHISVRRPDETTGACHSVCV